MTCLQQLVFATKVLEFDLWYCSIPCMISFVWHFQHESVSGFTTAKLWESTFIAVEHRRADKIETLPIKCLTLDLHNPTSGISICSELQCVYVHCLQPCGLTSVQIWSRLILFLTFSCLHSPELIWHCISITYCYTTNVSFLIQSDSVCSFGMRSYGH